MIISNCKTGDLSESIFVTESIRRGYSVYTPNFGHSHSADVMVVKPPCRPIAMQLKTATLSKKRSRDYGIMACRGRGLARVPYRLGDFDFLAAWLPDIEKFVFWHLTEIVSRKKINYSPLRHRAPGNWELLTLGDFSPDEDIITVQPCPQ